MTHRIILDQAITVPRSEEHDELWRTRVVPLLEDPPTDLLDQLWSLRSLHTEAWRDAIEHLFACRSATLGEVPNAISILHSITCRNRSVIAELASQDLIELFVSSGQSGRAIQACKEHLSRFPNRASLLGVCHWWARIAHGMDPSNLAEAEGALSNLLDLWESSDLTTSGGYWYYKGRFLQGRNEPEGARRCFERGIKEDSDRVHGFNDSEYRQAISGLSHFAPLRRIRRIWSCL